MCDEGLSNMTLELYHNILGYCCNILTLFQFGNLPLLNRVLLLKVVNKFVVSLHIVVAVSSMSLWFVLHPIFHNPTTSTRLKLFPFLKWTPRLCSSSFQPCLLFVYITIWPHYCRSARTQIPDPLMSTRLSLIYLFFSSLPLCFDYLCFSPAPVLMQTGRGVRRMSHTWSNLFWLLPPAIRGLDISFLQSVSHVANRQGFRWFNTAFFKLFAFVQSPFLIQPSEQVRNNYSDQYDMSQSYWMQI